MRASRGEIKIEEILTQNGLSFAQEYTFPDLNSFSGHPLRFDFAVFDDSGRSCIGFTGCFTGHETSGWDGACLEQIETFG